MQWPSPVQTTCTAPTEGSSFLYFPQWQLIHANIPQPHPPLPPIFPFWARFSEPVAGRCREPVSEVLVVSWCLSVMSGNTCHSSTRKTLLCHEDWLIYAPAADAKKKMLGACAIRTTILAELSLGQSAFLATNPKAVFRHFCICPRPFAHTEKYNYLCTKNILFLSPPKPEQWTYLLNVFVEAGWGSSDVRLEG